MKGRGTGWNPRNRFEPLAYERDSWAEEDPAPGTEFLEDGTRSIVARNESPDVPFEVSVNPYRGCEHGCSYCFARPNHEYLGFSAGLDFETRILVKRHAAVLLEKELRRKSWKPQPLALSGVTDPYQPIERRLELTRACIATLAEFRNPVVIITKNDLVVRDSDLLGKMAQWNGSLVYLSITTLDPHLAGVMEPRASTPGRRLAAVEGLARAGVPVGVMVAPVVPGLNEHEIPSILKASADAGARQAAHVPLRLPFGVADLFETWLEEHFPHKKAKVMRRIESIRGGRRNDPSFGSRMRGEGPYAREIHSLFDLGCRRSGLNTEPVTLSVSEFRRVGEAQASLF